MKIEQISKAVFFVFSVSGFYKNAIEYFKKHGIAWSSDRRWMEQQDCRSE